MESFAADAEIVYPEEFVGSYIEDHKLVVELTCDDEYIMEKYETLLREFDCVVYKKVEYSYNYLCDLANETNVQLREAYPVTKVYVDVINNCACIEIADGKEAEVDAQYRQMRNHSDHVVFKPGAYAQPQTLRLFGGSEINNRSCWFTLGFWGKYQGRLAIITCGHDLMWKDRIYYDSDFLGIVKYQKF